MESGPWFGTSAGARTSLERSFRAGQADPLLDGDYRRFFFESLSLFPRLGARAGARVEEARGSSPAELARAALRLGATGGPFRRDVPATARIASRARSGSGGATRPRSSWAHSRPVSSPRSAHGSRSDGAEPFALTSPPRGPHRPHGAVPAPGNGDPPGAAADPVAFGLLLPLAVWPAPGEARAP